MMLLLSSADLVQKSLDPDQDRHSGSPDLGPNCLQSLSVDDKVSARKERVEDL